MIKKLEISKEFTSEEFFRYYSERPSYEKLPLLTADGL